MFVSRSVFWSSSSGLIKAKSLANVVKLSKKIKIITAKIPIWLLNIFKLNIPKGIRVKGFVSVTFSFTVYPLLPSITVLKHGGAAWQKVTFQTLQLIFNSLLLYRNVKALRIRMLKCLIANVFTYFYMTWDTSSTIFEKW